MVKQPIRNMHSTKKVPPRFCDVVIEDSVIYLEKKTEKNIERIPWDDVVMQVKKAQSRDTSQHFTQ